MVLRHNFGYNVTVESAILTREIELFLNFRYGIVTKRSFEHRATSYGLKNRWRMKKKVLFAYSTTCGIQ